MAERPDDPRITQTRERARPGETRGRMWRVLSVSIAAAVLALAIIYAGWVLVR